MGVTLEKFRAPPVRPKDRFHEAVGDIVVVLLKRFRSRPFAPKTSFMRQSGKG